MGKKIDSNVNAMIGTALGVGFVTPQQGIYFGIILFLCIPFMFINLINGLLIFSCLYGCWWKLTGNDPRKFFEKMRQPKEYISVEPLLDFNRSGIPIPKQERKVTTTFRIKGQKRTFHHIEKKFLFYTYGQIELEGKEIGFYLLRRGSELMFIFAWTVSGHAPSMTEVESQSILSACTEALNNLPKDIDLKFYEDVEKYCDDYLKMQAGLLLNNELDPLSQEAIRSRARRAEELKNEGRLLKHTVSIYAKYRVQLGGDYAVNLNFLEELISKTQPIVGMLRGQHFDTVAAWSKVIDFAYKYAYKKVNFLLSDNKGGFSLLKAKTMSVQDIFERDYLELHELTKQNPEVPRTPQYIVYNEFGLGAPVINQYGNSALGTLFEPQGGCPASPKFDKHLVYYPIKNKYAGFVRIGQIRSYTKDRGSIERGYLKHLWKLLAGNNKALYDCRVVSEITADRSGFEIISLDRIISNSLKREALAAKRQTVDVVAIRRREQAIEARDELADNNIPFWVSFGIWLYRDTKDELKQDLRELASQITGAAVEEEENCAEDVWFQSLPFEWSAFLTKPNHRRQKYISYQTVPCIPLVKIEKLNKKGVLFVTRDLRTPIYLDFANKQNHTAIIAKTGSGKSNIILDILLEYIIHHYALVLFDFPRPNGSSTFTLLIPLLQELGVKAAYHNVRENVMNIIELPDLSSIEDDTERTTRLQQAMDNHLRLLCTLVLGTVPNQEREMTVMSLLGRCYRDFHKEPTIKQRYKKSIAGGYGSEAYSKMPILEDFVGFAQKWFANYIDEKGSRLSGYSNDTIDIILSQLEGVLTTALGRSINGISSFDIKVQVLVIGLTNVSESMDSLVYAMSGLNALYRASFSAKRSMLGVDEGTRLYKFPAFARETGTIPIHGRKWGCNFLIAAQEITSILNSCSGGEIFKNIDNIFGGHIGSAALPEMTSEQVGFKPEIISSYTSKGYKPSAELGESYWYLKRGDAHIEIAHPGNDLLLGLGATEPEEDEDRKLVLSKYPDQKIEGVKAYSRLNKLAKKRDVSIQKLLA